MAQLVEVSTHMGSYKTLRADAVCLVAASTIAFLMDASGMPIAGVGFADAHELALIAGLLLWSASPRPCWQLSAAAVHALFAAANLAHWQNFVSADILAAGYGTTFMHLLFVALQCLAARHDGHGRADFRKHQVVMQR